MVVVGNNNTLLQQMIHQQQATGTVVAPKKPSHIVSQQALRCQWCGCVWMSAPYNPEDDPPVHRLMCVEGWTPEFLTWTFHYWSGCLQPVCENDDD